MQIKIIETETGDILSREDTDRMGLPFEKGWASWGVFTDAGYCLDSFPSFPQAVEFSSYLTAPLPLAA